MVNTGASSLEKSPDRRAWERVSEIMCSTENIGSSTKKIIAGIVGVKAASAFFESFGQTRIIPADKVLKNFQGAIGTIGQYAAHELAILNDSIFRCIENDKYGTDQACSDNLYEYAKWLTDTGRRESMAHFCSIFEAAEYSKANLFIMTQAQGTFKLITGFIKSL